MDRATFFKHFDLLADQADALAKMRGLVLELAVRGQLVEHNSKDEPAAKLLEKIKTEKREFLRANKFKEAEALAQIHADEAPFKCPSAWEWVRLGSISNRIHYGYTASADHSQRDVRLLRITDIQNNQVNWEIVPGCQISAQEVAKYALHDNDILIARTGGTIGKTFLVANVAVKAVFASYLIRVIPSSQISAQYLKLFLESPCYWQQLLAKSAGTGQPNVNGEALSSLCISLPPLAEQRRIVAKVDELMVLCDELEQRQQARQHESGLLQQSALHHLLAAREPLTCAAAWQRVGDHFHLLHDTPDAIPQLRQAILQLAVQGRLVQQNPKDEPAAELLRKIAVKTKRLEEKDSSQIDWAESTHIPVCDLPTNWRWARFDHVATISSNLVQPSSFANLPHVAPDNIEKGTGRLLPYRTVKDDDVRSANHRFFPGQIVYSKIRPNLSKAVIVGFEGLCSADMYPINPHINADYLLRYILSQTFLSMAVRNDTRIAMPKINQEELNRVLVAVPPLAEQKRIVARVEELLGWCDTLETQLHQTRTLGTQLLDSTIHHLFVKPEQSGLAASSGGRKK